MSTEGLDYYLNHEKVKRRKSTLGLHRWIGLTEVYAVTIGISKN